MGDRTKKTIAASCFTTWARREASRLEKACEGPHMQHGRSGFWPLRSISEIRLIGVLHVHSSTCRDPAVRVSARDGGPGARAPVKSDRWPAFFPCQDSGGGTGPCSRPRKHLTRRQETPDSSQAKPHLIVPSHGTLLQPLPTSAREPKQTARGIKEEGWDRTKHSPETPPIGCGACSRAFAQRTSNVTAVRDRPPWNTLAFCQRLNPPRVALASSL